MSCHWCWRPVVSYVTKVDDTELQLGMKKRAVVMGIAGVMISLISLIAIRSSPILVNSPLRYANVVFSLVPSAVLLVYVLCTKSAPACLFEGATYGWTTSVLIAALLASQNGTPGQWHSIVVFLDMCLVNELNPRVTNVTLAMTCVCLAAFHLIAAVDPALNLGESHVCDCDTPPCRLPTDTGSVVLIMDIVILLLDFYLTRGFAQQVLKEKASMSAAINTAESVAVCLGGFDLDAADALLQGESAQLLPGGLTDALHQLLENLRVYKPYLPKSCLPLDDEIVLHQSSHDFSNLLTDASPQRRPSLVRRTSGSAILIAKRCTVVVTNIHNSIACLDTENTDFLFFFSRTLQNTLTHVEQCRGMVDVFIGDKIWSSFNASRHCAQHANGAVRAVKLLTSDEDRLNSGIATGRTHCGDMGCIDMRRFSFMGRLPLITAGLERAGRALGLPILCTPVTKSDTELEHDSRLVPCPVAIKKPAACDRKETAIAPESEYLRVFEVLPDIVNTDPVVKNEEWMYQMQSNADKWDHYNRCVRKYLDGADVQEMRDCLASTSDEQCHIFGRMIESLGSRDPMSVLF